VNTCPMMPASGSSPGRGCTLVRPKPSLLHPPYTAWQRQLQLLQDWAEWSAGNPSILRTHASKTCLVSTCPDLFHLGLHPQNHSQGSQFPGPQGHFLLL
jgi:hypothetical protein